MIIPILKDELEKLNKENDKRMDDLINPKTYIYPLLEEENNSCKCLYQKLLIDIQF